MKLLDCNCNKIADFGNNNYSDYFAVFVVAKIGNFFIGTTRTDGKIALPGGKIDKGESLVEAAFREAKEEGWLVAVAPEIIHEAFVDGRRVAWLRGYNPQMLFSYKEQSRGIRPVLVPYTELTEGFGNEFLANYGGCE